MSRGADLGARRRRVLIALGVAASLAGLIGLVVVGGTAVFLRSPAGNAQMLSVGLSVAQGYAGDGALRAETLSTDLTSRAELDAIGLDGPSGELIGADHVAIAIDPWTLGVHLPVVRAHGWRARVRVGDDGAIELLDVTGYPLDTLKKPIPVDVRIDRLELAGGTVELDVAGNRATVRGVSLIGAVQAGPEGIDLTGLQIVGAVDGPIDSPFGLTGAARWEGDRLVLSDVRLAVRDSRIGLGGSIEQVFEGGDLDLSATVDRLTPELADPFLGSPGLRGELVGSATVTGPWERIAVHADLDGAAGTRAGILADVEIRPAPAATAWTIGVDLDAVRLDDVHPALDAPMEVSGRVELEGAGTAIPEGLSAQGTFRGRSSALGLHIEDVDAGVELVRTQLTLRDGTARGEMGSVRFAGGADLRTMDVNLDVGADLDLDGLGPLGIPPELVDGRGELLAHVTGSLMGRPALDVGGSVALGPMIVGPQVEAGGGSATFTAELRGLDVTVVADAEAHAVHAYGVDIPAVSLPGLTATYRPLRADAPTEGGLAVQARAQVERYALGDLLSGAATADIAFDADLRGTNLAVVRADLGPMTTPYVDLDGGSATVDWGIQSRTPRFDVQLLRDAAVVADARGQVDLAHATAAIEHLVVTPVPGQRWQADPTAFGLGDGAVTGLDVHLVSDRGEISVRGDIDLDGPLALDLDVVGLDPRVAAELFPQRLPQGLPALHGVIGLTGRVEGTTAAPTLVADLDASGLGADGVVDGLWARGPVSAGDGELHTTLDVGAAQNTLLRVKAAVPVELDVRHVAPALDRPLSAEVHVVEPRVGPWVELIEGLPPAVVEELVWLDPRIEGDAVIGGTLRSPTLVATGGGSVPISGLREPGNARFRLTREGEAIELIGKIEAGSRTLVSVDGGARTDLDRALAFMLGSGERPAEIGTVGLYLHDVDATAKLRDFDVHDLVNVFSPYDLDLMGTVNGNLRVRSEGTLLVADGTLAVRDGTIGNVPLDDFEAVIAPYRGGYELHAHADFAPIDNLRDRRHPLVGGLTIDGEVPVRVDLAEWPRAWPQGDVMIAVSGPGVPIGVASALVPDLRRGQGLVAVAGGVVGPITDLRPDLHLSLVDGRIEWGEVGVRYTGIDLDARADLERIAFDVTTDAEPIKALAAASIAFGDSGAAVHGEVPLNGFALGELGGTVDLDRFLAAGRRDQLLRVSTDEGPLQLQGTWPHVGVRGHVRVDQCDVSVTQKLMQRLGLIDGPPTLLDPRIDVIRDGFRSVPGGPPKGPFWEPFTADLTIDIGNRAEGSAEFPYLQSFGGVGATASTIEVHGRLGGELHATLADGQPIVQGTVDVISGEARVLDSKFIVERGTVAFLDDDYMNPTADILAHGQVPGARLDMHIRGKPSDADVDFSSPDLHDPDQVLFAVVTGVNPTDTDAGEAATLLSTAALRVAMRQYLSGVNLGAFQIKDRYASVSVRIGTGWALTPRIRTGYVPSSDSRALQLEWAYDPRVTIVGSLGDYSQSVAVYWRRRW